MSALSQTQVEQINHPIKGANMLASGIGKILSNLAPQINPPTEKKSNSPEILSVQEIRNVKLLGQIKVIERTNDYMNKLYNEIIYPHLQTKSTGRPKAPMILLKLIVGRMIEAGWGRCVVKQEVLGSEMMQYGYDKPLTDRQIRRHIKLLKDIGLIDYQRSAGHKSVYEYTATPEAIDIYFYLIKRNVSYVRLCVLDTKTGAVDKIYTKKQVSRKPPLNVPSQEKNVVKIQSRGKPDVRSNRSEYIYNTSPSSFNSRKEKIQSQKPSKKEPLKELKDQNREANKVSTLKVNYVNPDRNVKMNDTQESIFDKVCKDLGLDNTKTTIFRDETEKGLAKGLNGGRTLADFEFRLKSLYAKVAQTMYW
ncbi:hypothetical protein UFOVP270_2 [uncultured Caudovirales phage]|uniref:Uncharacterized protein n=1 Tax=uncultured Caudovirales phage TaxID=2100421 RepID=A0A6J5LII9_9CAUD|nr:hypothetical protein UFOVP101_54 [uncultured Caudovirales phage]CAB4133991.1 hypothetical protein UFOVP270_2 [uncultured Caudovirales phage]